MKQGSETSFPSNPAGRAPSASTTIRPPVVISPILDKEILLVHPTADARNSTVIDRPDGGSEELRYNIPAPLVLAPVPPASRENFIALAKWTGRVLEVNGSAFRAILLPVIGDQSQKEAEIYVEDVSPEDRDLVRNGAAFYWSVGYLDRPSGRIRASLLRFARTPHWSSRDVADAKDQARRYLDLFRDK